MGGGGGDPASADVAVRDLALPLQVLLATTNSPASPYVTLLTLLCLVQAKPPCLAYTNVRLPLLCVESRLTLSAHLSASPMLAFGPHHIFEARSINSL